MTAQAASFCFFTSPLQSLTAPVSSKYGCERIAPATHQDQAISDAQPLPWRLCRPRRTLVPLRVQWISQTRGYRFPGANPWLAHVAGDPFYCSGDGTASHSGSWLVVQAPCQACRRRRYSCKAARHVKGFVLLGELKELKGPKELKVRN